MTTDMPPYPYHLHSLFSHGPFNSNLGSSENVDGVRVITDNEAGMRWFVGDEGMVVDGIASFRGVAASRAMIETLHDDTCTECDGDCTGIGEPWVFRHDGGPIHLDHFVKTGEIRTNTHLLAIV